MLHINFFKCANIKKCKKNINKINKGKNIIKKM